MLNRRAQLFAIDLLLAMVPLTILLGMSANALSGVAFRAQDYSNTYDIRRITTDAADIFIKSPGDPEGWDNLTVDVLGFASIEDDFIYNHILNSTKLTYFRNASLYPPIRDALRNMSHGRNIVVNISASDADYNLRVMGYTDAGGTWTVTTNDATIDSELAGADDLFIVERVTRIGTAASAEVGFLWNYTGDDIVQSSPTIADIDCDGSNEIIIGANAIGGGDGGIMVFEPNGSLKWTYTSGKSYTSTPAVVNLDSDCELEVIIGESPCPGEGECEASNITAVDHDGSFMWNVTMKDATWNAPLVGDIDYDGVVEIIIGSMQGADAGSGVYDASIYVINGDTGNIQYTFSSCTCADSAYPALCAGEVGIPCTTKSRNKGGQIIADLDGNSSNGLEIIGNTCDTYIFAFHGKDGSFFWSDGNASGHYHTGPAAADIDGDGNMELIANAKDSTIYAWTYNASLDRMLPIWDAYSDVDKGSPVIADLDNSGDGNLEIVVGGKDGVIRAFYNNGSSFWTYDIGGLAADDNDEIQSSPAIADIDDDCLLEVVIGTGKDNKGAVSTEHSHLLALNAEDGSLLFDEDTVGGLVSSPSIGDIDGDGDQEIVVGSDSKNIYVFDVTGYGDGWPSYHQAEASMTSTKIWRTGEWTGSLCGVTSAAYSDTESRARITANIQVYVW